MRDVRGKLVLLAAALGLSVALVGLLAATEATLRVIEHRDPLTKTLKPEPTPQDSTRDGAYHHPGATGWMTP
ncbi:MAG TPA: hypothetical protein VGT00_11230 [Methylomirabilota bacterium]|jgi:hypothetical protein|nr:hypothetical protein [Methylomirabilota bacterium]